MTPDELRAIMEFLRQRVSLGPPKEECPVTIAFDAPTEKEMIDAGLSAEGAKRILAVPWWEEMVEDIVETPDMCEPDEPPPQVLDYARDVVSEYIHKRFLLNEE